MRVSVLGLGYVGAVSAGCLAEEGHEVVGVDPESRKVDLINEGKTPIIEQEIGQIIERQVAAGRLSATTDVASAVRRTDLIMICVGTPSRANGDIDLKYVARVCEQVGAALRDHSGAPVVVVRSTMLPGTMRELVIPTLEASSGKRAGIAAAHDSRAPGQTDGGAGGRGDAFLAAGEAEPLAGGRLHGDARDVHA